MLEPGALRICWFRAKIYSILLPNGKPKITAKGVSRLYILKHLHHKDYLRILKGTESTIAIFSTIRSIKLAHSKSLKNVSVHLTTNVTPVTTK